MILSFFIRILQHNEVVKYYHIRKVILSFFIRILQNNEVVKYYHIRRVILSFFIRILQRNEVVNAVNKPYLRIQLKFRDNYFIHINRRMIKYGSIIKN